MPTYIDESGDTGRVVDGGKRYFRLAAVWVPTDDEVRSFQQALLELRERLKLRADYEFKFSKTSNREQRAAFFDLACSMSWNFCFAFSQVDKSQAESKEMSGKSQYWSCAIDLAVALRPVYIRQESLKGKPLRERVIVDKNDSPLFLEEIETQFTGLKSPLFEGKSLVHDVKYRKSHKEAMLQLVDMICGAAGCHIDGDSQWYERIKHFEIDALHDQQTQTGPS